MAFNTTEAKSIFTSVTFWGSVVSLAAMFFPHIYGAIAGTATQTTVVAYIVSGIGFVITVYGRLRATQPASLTGK